MYCFFKARDGFLQIQSFEEKAQTSGNSLFPHISGLVALQPYVCNSVSCGRSGALKGIERSFLFIIHLRYINLSTHKFWKKRVSCFSKFFVLYSVGDNQIINWLKQISNPLVVCFVGYENLCF